jgi:hypothetical protein
MIRLTVTFDDQTGRTLFKLAHREMRNPRDQVVYMIKQALVAMANQSETGMNEVANTQNAIPRG